MTTEHAAILTTNVNLTTTREIYEFQKGLIQLVAKIRRALISESELDRLIQVVTSREDIWQSSICLVRELREIPSRPNWAEQKLWEGTQKFRLYRQLPPTPCDNKLRLLRVQEAESQVRLQGLLPHADEQQKQIIQTIQQGWIQLLEISIYDHRVSRSQATRATGSSSESSRSTSSPTTSKLKQKTKACSTKEEARNKTARATTVLSLPQPASSAASEVLAASDDEGDCQHSQSEETVGDKKRKREDSTVAENVRPAKRVEGTVVITQDDSNSKEEHEKELKHQSRYRSFWRGKLWPGA